jgi:hypothetical protein
VKPPRIEAEEPFALVDKRADAVRDYLLWARANDNEQWSFRMTARTDIGLAAEASKAFPEPRWGVVVFTCASSRGLTAADPLHEDGAPARALMLFLCVLRARDGTTSSSEEQPGPSLRRAGKEFRRFSVKHLKEAGKAVAQGHD